MSRRAGATSPAPRTARQPSPGFIIEAPVLERDGSRQVTVWQPDTPPVTLAHGSAEPRPLQGRASAADLDAAIRVELAGVDEPMLVEWTVTVARSMRMALELAVTVPDAVPDARSMFLPGIHHGWEDLATGIGPRLDPARGFLVRADRLAQVGVLLAGRTRIWGISTDDDSPRPARPGLMYAVGVSADDAQGMQFILRYPQAEAGHLGDGTGTAYVAKETLGIGECRQRWYRAGDRLVIRMWLWSFEGTATRSHVGTIARWAWQTRRVEWQSERDALAAARARLRWLAAAHWDPALGQYASPNGSGTALAGFVEMSLAMAIISARMNDLGLADATSPNTIARDLDAVDGWIAGPPPIKPVWRDAGARPGRRIYVEPGLRITDEQIIEAIRPAAEARALLGLARQFDGVDARAPQWAEAAVGTALWLDDQRVDGRLPSIIGGARPMPAGDGAATAMLVSLLADAALDRDRASDAADLLARTRDAYARAVEPRILTSRFGGVTLDAACADRESASAALDAALGMFEATSEPGFLDHARTAADTVLAYVFSYPIATFTDGTDAMERRISTVGGSLVSAENQHLDPYPVGSGLIRYGLYADDSLAIRAGVANLAWCLDGRWAIETPLGTRQPEQFNQTRWHYNAWFTQRGDFRRGIPAAGAIESEHGWAQALPLGAFLDQGHLTVDWPSGRVAALPGFRAMSRRTADGIEVRLPRRTGRGGGADGDGRADRHILLRILRPPQGRVVRIHAASEVLEVPWPRSLVAVVVDASAGIVRIDD